MPSTPSSSTVSERPARAVEDVPARSRGRIARSIALVLIVTAVPVSLLIRRAVEPVNRVDPRHSGAVPTVSTCTWAVRLTRSQYACTPSGESSTPAKWSAFVCGFLPSVPLTRATAALPFARSSLSRISNSFASDVSGDFPFAGGKSNSNRRASVLSQSLSRRTTASTTARVRTIRW